MSTGYEGSEKKPCQGTCSTCGSIGKSRDDCRRRQGPCIGYSHQRFLHKETLVQLLEKKDEKKWAN